MPNLIGEVCESLLPAEKHLWWRAAFGRLVPTPGIDRMDRFRHQVYGALAEQCLEIVKSQGPPGGIPGVVNFINRVIDHHKSPNPSLPPPRSEPDTASYAIREITAAAALMLCDRKKQGKSKFNCRASVYEASAYEALQAARRLAEYGAIRHDARVGIAYLYKAGASGGSDWGPGVCHLDEAASQVVSSLLHRLSPERSRIEPKIGLHYS